MREAKFENTATIWERVKKSISQRGTAPPLPWGIRELDQITHGISAGKLTILGARTSVGKTSLGLQVARGLADSGKTVGYLSLEDDREQLVEKIFCNMMCVDNQVLKRGRVPLMDDPSVEKIFENLKLLVLDDYGYDFDEVQAVLTNLNPKPDVIFLDYLQMMDWSKARTRYEAYSEYVRQAKKFAEHYNVGLVLLSQVNREGARDKRPKKHHLAQSGDIEQVADMIVLMHHPWGCSDTSYDYMTGKDSTGKTVTIQGFEECPQDYTELIVAKNKVGPLDTVPVKFTGKHYKFEDWGG